MSHFNCLIIGEVPMTHEDFGSSLHKYLEDTLAPFDENAEVDFKDTTEEYRENYETGTYKEYKPVNPEDPFSESVVVSEVPHKEKYATFDQFCEECYDETANEEGRHWYMYNPNAKWDWWVLGGRWQGYFIHKVNPKFPERIFRGERSFLLSEEDDDIFADRRCDTLALCDVDWEAMKEERIASAEMRWEEEERKKASGSKGAFMMINWGREEPITKEQYLAEAASVVPCSFIFKGSFEAVGEMGWFGISTNEKSCGDWSKVYEMALDEANEDWQISCVDCHI